MYGVEVIIRNIYKIGVEEAGSVAGAGAVNGQDGLGSDAPDQMETIRTVLPWTQARR